jgi:TetR/AcrR family transcriptional regulator
LSTKISVLFEHGEIAMTLAERKQREREQRQLSIINAASRLFSLKGFDKVSMDEIAFEAELSKTTLYFYFEDKESLFFAVVNRGTKIYNSILKEEEERIRVIDIKGSVLNAARMRFLTEYPDYLKNYFYFRSGRFAISNEDDLNNDAKEILEFAKCNFKRTLSEMKVCIEDGTLRSDMNPVVITAFSYLIYGGILINDPILSDILKIYGFTVQQIQQEVLDLMQRLVLRNPGE